MSLFTKIFLLCISDTLKKRRRAERSDWQIACTYFESLTDLLLSPAAMSPQGSRCPETNGATGGGTSKSAETQRAAQSYQFPGD